MIFHNKFGFSVFTCEEHLCANFPLFLLVSLCAVLILIQDNILQIQIQNYAVTPNMCLTPPPKKKKKKKKKTRRKETGTDFCQLYLNDEFMLKKNTVHPSHDQAESFTNFYMF